MTQEEADNSTMQNVLVRALGIDPDVEVDLSEVPLLEGDTLLLCSDGLTRELTDAQIAAVLGERRNAETAAADLVDLAKQAGGGDNVTVIVLRCVAKPLARWRASANFSRNRRKAAGPVIANLDFSEDGNAESSY